jgi:hypothetical protein
MSNLPVTKWFDELKRVWLEKDIAALHTILAEDCSYYEDPFLSPLTTWKGIESAWQEVKEQDIHRLEIDVLVDGHTEGSAMYHFIYTDSLGIRQESRGAYYLKLNAAEKATEFRQWWTTQ